MAFIDIHTSAAKNHLLINMRLFDKLFGGTKKKSGPEPPNTGFTTSDTMMDEEQFWRIIQTSKEHANYDYEQQQEELANELRKLALGEIILFENRFRYFRGMANTWELWAAIYIIHRGCGDDSFNDFREWVIGQGKEFYYRTINDPETLVDVDTDKIEDVEWEGLGYVAATVFEELTGKQISSSYRESLETKGKEWREEGNDLKQMYPRLAAKYSKNI